MAGSPVKAPGELLFLHTSDLPGLVAATHAGRLEVEILGARGPRERTLLAAVDSVLARLGIAVGALHGALVTIGPGSFTGIRVGIATAQGLAAARGWGLWICDSLVVEAAACRGDPVPVAVCHDARRGEVYVALYDVSGDSPVALVPPFCAPPGPAWERLVRALPLGKRFDLVGSGASLMAGAGAAGSAWMDGALPEPIRPERLARAAIALAVGGGCQTVEAMQIEPHYLRNPDVQLPRAGE